MKRFYLRAIKDIRDNRFLTAITVITIALSIMIAAAFALFFINAGDVLTLWQKGIRMMVYLDPEVSETGRIETKSRLQAIAGVQEAHYISREDALERLRGQMQHHAALLDNLRDNPLPEAFEVTLQAGARDSDTLQFLAERISGLETVAEVEYGQQWIGRFTSIIKLFSLAGYAIGGLFFMATVFIVANTIRLVLYARREEIEIMRLVGATDRFIKIPFYLQGMIQGGLGSFLGLTALFLGYFYLTRHFGAGGAGEMFQMRFFPAATCAGIVLGGMVVGWLGSWVSLKQFLK
ncbi:MAG: permease-like cell division protein FtsX [Desulfatitalea sp.]|nr:permease-like cell division protein FtsX [Desulfatitalea sp.]